MRPFEFRVLPACQASVRCLRLFALALYALLALVPSLLGQTPPNPVPFVDQPLVPTAVAPGGPDFTLTVNGAGFVPESVVQWNGSPRPTTFVSNTQLTAAIPATDIATIGSASVTVLSPAPGGGVSNPVLFLITFPISSVTFSRTDFGTDGDAVAVVSADFNGDGKADVAALRDYEVLIFLGNGDGTFQVPRSFPTGGYSGSAILAGIAAADFNKDGKADLAVTNHHTSADPAQGSISVLLGNGDRTFQPAVNYPVLGFSPTAIVTADFNGDGALDLAVVGLKAAGGALWIFLGKGDGTFLAGEESAALAGSPYSIVAVGNGDGVIDLAIHASYGGVSTFVGNGDGTFELGSSFAGNQGFSISAADFDGNGHPDLAYDAYYDTSVTHSIVAILGGASYELTIDSAFRDLLPADVDGDEKLDLVISASRGFFVLGGNGNGTFRMPASFYASALAPTALAVGDFDNDGRVDLAAGNYYSPLLSVFMQPSPVDLEPGGLHFGDHLVGTPSSSGTATLTNNLTVPLTISNITLTGPDSDDFAETNDCPLSPSTLAAGDSCTISVTFFHTTLGAKAAVVTISNDALGYPQQVLNLTGTIVDPAVTLSSVSLNFGDHPLDVTSAARSVTLTNSGVGTLTILGTTVTGDFTATDNCGTRLAQGAQCVVSVTFRPTNPGTLFGLVTITDNAATSPHIISLVGTGVPPAVTLSTTSLTFGDQNVRTTSPPQTVTLTNNGPGPLTFTGVSQTNEFGATSDCANTVAPSASCTISVTFSPEVNGTRTGTVTIHSNAVGSPHTVSLTGTGLGPEASVSPHSLNFPDQPVGTTSPPQTVTLTNSGAATMTLSGILATSPFGETTNCTATLSAGGSCAISVTFTPAFLGTTYGAVLISDDAPGSPQAVSLTGTTPVNFPDQPVGATSAPQSVTLTNLSTTPRVISGITTTGDFASSGGCSTLPAGGSCAVSVTFTPMVEGTRTGSLIVADDAPGSPHRMTLSGTGTSFALNVQSGGSTSATVNAGQTATYNLQIEPRGFSGGVALSCAFQGTQPRGASCSVSPSAVALNGTDPAQLTVRVSTTAGTLAAPNPFSPQGPRGLWARHFAPVHSAWLIVLAMLLGIAGVAAALRPARGNPRLEPLSTPPAVTLVPRVVRAVTLLAVLVWAACGGGGSAPLPPQDRGTPAGNYTLILSATATGVTETIILGLHVN